MTGNRGGTAQSQSKQRTSSASHSQSLSMATAANFELNEGDYEVFTSSAVFHVLAQERKRVLVKKPDLMKAIGLTGRPADVQRHVMDDVVEKMHDVFGLQLEESDKRGVYFVLNKLRESPSDPERNHLKWSDKENANLALLFPVLALIFMSNGFVSDDTLFKFLGRMGVYDPAEDSRGRGSSLLTVGGAAANPVPEEIRDLFGNVRDLVFNQWGARMRYLDISKQNLSEDKESYEIRWGPRAKLEVRKEDILDIVSKLYECPTTAFKEQYDEIEKEKQGAQPEVEVQPADATQRG